jgi:hypothetical protein
VHVKDVQVIQQEQYSDPDDHQGRNDARDVSLESPILVWLHEFSMGEGGRIGDRKSANTPVLPAAAPSMWRGQRSMRDHHSSKHGIGGV